MDDKFENGWREWSKHVLAELKRLDHGHAEINKSVQKTHLEIATLKVRASMWGLLAGSIPPAIVLLIKYLK